MNYQLEFDRKDLLAFGIGTMLLAIVLYLAGFFTEVLVARQTLYLPTRRSPSPARGPATADVMTKKALAAKRPATTPTAGTAPTPGAAAASTPALELAVQVGSFAEPAKAKQAAEQLQRQGFSPAIASRVDAANHQISVVEVGPFSSWEQASQVAHLIGRSLGTRPLIRPML